GAEQVFDLAPEAVFLGEDTLLAFEFGEFAQEFFLARTEFFGHFDLDDDDEIAAPTGAEVGQARAVDAEDRAVLGAPGDDDGSLVVEGRHFDVGAEGGLGVTDGHLKDQVVAVALEDLVLLNSNDDMQVAPHAGPLGGELGWWRFAFAADAHGLTIADA